MQTVADIITGGTFDGIARENPTPAGIREAWNRTYSLNTTSTQVITHVFAPLLIVTHSPRLLFITSGLSSLTTCASGLNAKMLSGPPSKGWPKPPVPSQTAYRASKSALNMLMLEWKRLLEPDGVKTFAISPGFLATNLGGMGQEFLRNMGAGDASVGGVFIKDVVEGKRDDDAGKVINKDGEQPW
jgi:NAD(P)-dependent dehydrogenase (short-subunit alcohol dehydrogenase family)